jgi:DNA-directed RNA polymerase specialized sigma24 family protein
MRKSAEDALAFPGATVAEAMDCAVGTVKSTLHSALLRLGVELSDQEDEPDAAR